MAATAILPSTFPSPAKRKHDDDAGTAAAQKKPRRGHHAHNNNSAAQAAAACLPLEPHSALLAELRPRYDVATFSVISSTSIARRIDQILAQLARFHPSDMAVLPGVALMHARARDAAKMVSVVELARRRVHEAGQKWFQYNRLYEVEPTAAAAEGNDTIVEETVFPGMDDSDDEDDDGFEMGTTQKSPVPNIFEQAVMGRPKHQHALYMSIFLSRVPIAELKAKSYITEQTNSDTIDQQQRRRFG